MFDLVVPLSTPPLDRLRNFGTPYTPLPGPVLYVIVEAAWEEGYGEEDPLKLRSSLK